VLSATAAEAKSQLDTIEGASLASTDEESLGSGGG
jgi:hypothetical protein